MVVIAEREERAMTKEKRVEEILNIDPELMVSPRNRQDAGDWHRADRSQAATRRDAEDGVPPRRHAEHRGTRRRRTDDARAG